MRLLTDWIQELTDGCLDDMQAAHDRNPGEPVNFHELLGFKLPVLVISALLGVPAEDRDYVSGPVRPDGQHARPCERPGGAGRAGGVHGPPDGGQAEEPW